MLLPGEPRTEEFEDGPGGDYTGFYTYVAIPFSSPKDIDSEPDWGRNLRILWGAAQSRVSNKESTYLVGYGELASPHDSAEDSLMRFRNDVLGPSHSSEGVDEADDWACSRTLVRESTLKLNGHPGLEIVFEEECREAKAGGVIVSEYRTRVFRVGTKVFVLEVMNSLGAADESDDAERFFDSFELL